MKNLIQGWKVLHGEILQCLADHHFPDYSYECAARTGLRNNACSTLQLLSVSLQIRYKGDLGMGLVWQIFFP